jgi:mercuric ion binding protein
VFLTINTFPVLAKDIQYTIRVDGISCPFCVATSEKALKKIAGVRDVESDLKEGTITVCADAEETSFTDKQLTELFKKNGFTYHGMEIADQC